MWPFKKKKVETRSSGSGFTAEIMAARESYVSGRTGLAELTATAQTCITLWENGLSIADVEGTPLLDPMSLAMIGRSLALRGEALFLITNNCLVPASDWETRTRNGLPTAYRLSISEAGGGQTQTALAGEVLHFRIACDPVAPWLGVAPLKRAQLTAGLLNTLEAALSEVFTNVPLGSTVLPMPEQPDTDMETLGRGFRGQRGRVLLRESVNVSAAGGPAPQTDWRPSDMSPDLQRAMTDQTLRAAREAICGAFGVLPALLASSAQGPLVREAQRHLAQWQLQPLALIIAREASLKLGSTVTLDTLRPLQAYDAGGRARALSTVVQALAQAKDAGVETDSVLRLVDWD